jgi:hypothetical protein
VTLRVTLTAAHGTISVNTNVTGGVSLGGVLNNGTSSVSLTGTPAAINATLANATGIVGGLDEIMARGMELPMLKQMLADL